MVKTYEQECSYIRQVSPVKYVIDKGFVDSMNVVGEFYVNDRLKPLLFDEVGRARAMTTLRPGRWLRASCRCQLMQLRCKRREGAFPVRSSDSSALAGTMAASSLPSSSWRTWLRFLGS